MVLFMILGAVLYVFLQQPILFFLVVVPCGILSVVDLVTWLTR